jgi:CBS domain containing-hemolysin-like protein
VVRLLVPLIWLLWPLVRLSRTLTRLLAGGTEQEAVSRGEVTALVEIGQREGVIDESESRVIEGLFRFPSLRVHDVMTPRTVLAALPEDTTVGEAATRDDEMRFSRIPIYGRDTDDVTGLVLKDEILLCAARGEHDTPLRAIRREIVVVPTTLSLSQLLKRLLSGQDHIALVVDEYGGTEGVVTLEDAVETLLGHEIVDETDPVLDMRALARERWLEQESGTTGDERRAAIRFGLTGNHPTPPADDETDPEPHP